MTRTQIALTLIGTINGCIFIWCGVAMDNVVQTGEGIILLYLAIIYVEIVMLPRRRR